MNLNELFSSTVQLPEDAVNGRLGRQDDTAEGGDATEAPEDDGTTQPTNNGGNSIIVSNTISVIITYILTKFW